MRYENIDRDRNAGRAAAIRRQFNTSALSEFAALAINVGTAFAIGSDNVKNVLGITISNGSFSNGSLV